MRKFSLLIFPALLTAVLLGACGGGTEETRVGNEADAAFVADMIPHHEGAVMMAMMAKQRAERPALDTMADEIIAAQQEEIAAMRSLQEDLPDIGAEGGSTMEMGGDHMGHTGMDAGEMGMDMDLDSLKLADSFDLAFIDMMIPHHQGAIEMARQLLQSGENPQLQRMARAIIASQASEIETMRNWRETWSEDGAEAES